MKDGERTCQCIKGPMGNSKSSNPRVSQKFAWRLNWKRWTNVKTLISEGNNKANKKVFGQNIKRIPKATGASPKLKNASTWQTSSSHIYCKKDKEKEANPNGGA